MDRKLYWQCCFFSHCILACLHLSLIKFGLLCAQPFDAAAAVMDGGLLGASETAYASRATLVVAGCVYGLLSVVPRMYPGLFGVWLSLKGLSVGRTLAASYRLASARSPLSKEVAGSSHAQAVPERSAAGAAASGAAFTGQCDQHLQQDASSGAGVHGEVLAAQEYLQDGSAVGDEQVRSVSSNNIVAGKIPREQGSLEVPTEKAQDVG